MLMSPYPIHEDKKDKMKVQFVQDYSTQQN